MCALGAVFLASTIYGQTVAPKDPMMDARVLGAAAAFATGFAAAQQPPPPPPTTPPPTPTVAPPTPTVAPQAYQATSCTSDFSCGIGYSCVKERYSASGFCAKAVDPTGTPTFQTPSSDSIGPNMGDVDCARNGCPTGFRCDISTGVCLK